VALWASGVRIPLPAPFLQVRFLSVLIQEIISLMYTPEQNAQPVLDAMHIHPALNEVVQRAFQSLMTTEQYRHMIEHGQYTRRALECAERDTTVDQK